MRAGAKRVLAGLAAALAVLILGPGTAGAAAPPQVTASWVTEVTASGATLRASVNPEGAATRYRFEYLSDAAYQANGFAGAAVAPPSGEPIAGSGVSPVQVNQHIGGLAPLTAYRYRLRATNSAGTTFGPVNSFTTQGASLVFSLLDDRGWEMVSPVDKNGGAIESVGTTAPRVFQAAAGGGAITYESIFSFGDPAGATAVSQYLARRSGEGWSSLNVTTPLVSGTYGDEPPVTPYQLFSPELSRGLLLDAPSGYFDYYRREADGSFTPLLTEAEVAALAIPPQNLELRLAAASPDLGHVVLSTCATLTPGATEVEAGPGHCDPAAQNLYEWSPAGLELVNVEPGDSTGTPGAAIAAQGGSVSADGSRVYWTGADGNLYLRERGAGSVQVDAAVGGGATFETASSGGSVAFFSKEGHLYRFTLAGGAIDLTPGGGVEGVLGASADGTYVYFETAAGLLLWHGGTTTAVAAAADASNYPPSSGTARVTPDGRHLAFLSSASLTGYDNAGRSEVFLYGPPPAGGAARLACVSCNPTGERPQGASTIPGAVANGEGPGAVDVYKPRSLSSDGSRVFFDSGDALVVQDTDGRPDAYEWEAGGAGTCATAGGCVQLLSDGRSAEGSSFVDASADGDDAFFLTDASLVPADPGLVDLYDARVGGGFAVPPTPLPCEGDACQGLPVAPEIRTPGTLVPNPGNPARPAAKKKHRKHRKHHHRKHRRHRHGAGRRAGR